jgi:hypothetical protein
LAEQAKNCRSHIYKLDRVLDHQAWLKLAVHPEDEGNPDEFLVEIVPMVVIDWLARAFAEVFAVIAGHNDECSVVETAAPELIEKPADELIGEADSAVIQSGGYLTAEKSVLLQIDLHASSRHVATRQGVNSRRVVLVMGFRYQELSQTVELFTRKDVVRHL